MDAVGFDNAFTFQYSPRRPAKAFRLKDDVPKEEKVRRLQGIVELQCRSSEKHNRSLVGSTVEVLVDGMNRKDASQLSGRTRTNRTAVFKGSRDLVGKLVNIKVGAATPYSITGL
jgi:tRNA-2-methylthio-N6-dimethylallyladenosine synthase